MMWKFFCQIFFHIIYFTYLCTQTTPPNGLTYETIPDNYTNFLLYATAACTIL